MLKRLEHTEKRIEAKIPISQAHFPAPFKEGLEFSSPARGTWNIVHTGMLIPEAHQIFVCAKGCLRGVVLTAAEMNAMGRYSAVEIREENVLDGNMEELMIEGVSDVLAKLPYTPRAVLLFISCQHFFLAYDQGMVFDSLRERFPHIDFTDCYMIPTLRKSGLTPDQKMRMQMYSLLKPKKKNYKKINLIGSNLPLCETSELKNIVDSLGCELQQLNGCKTYDEYLDMAEATLNIIYEPIAIMAGEELKKRLGQDYIYLPFVFDAAQLEGNYKKLEQKIREVQAQAKNQKDKNQQTSENEVDTDVTVQEVNVVNEIEKIRSQAEAALVHAKELIGDTPIAVDYTFTFRILNFTRMLIEHGFHVTEIYADAFQAEEQEDFNWIQEHAPEIVIGPCLRPQMRYADRDRAGKLLALGQKAAYFTGTDYFVNVVESGGYFGFDGIVQIAKLMEEAFLQEKDMKTLIQRKGYGCESCI